MGGAHGEIVGFDSTAGEGGPEDWKFGGRYRIRTYDFHRVRMALYR
jgi:hypothetical protein